MNTRLFSMTIIKALTAIAQMLFAVTIAALFGISEELDAYWVAASFIGVFSFIFIEAQSKSFIPFISKATTETEIRNKTGLVIKINILLFSLLTLIVFNCSSTIIRIFAPGLSTTQVGIATNMLKIISFVILQLNLTGILKGDLEFRQHFKTAAIAELLVPVISILVLLLIHDRFSWYSLPLASVAGQTVTLFILASIIISRFSIQRTTSPLISQDSKQYFSMMIPIMFSALFFGIISLSETYISSLLDKGSLSSYTYAQRIVKNLPILAAPICTMYFPIFSKLIASHRTNELLTEYQKGLEHIVLISAIITSLLFITADSVVMILFERGSFTHSDTIMVSKIIRWLSIMLFCNPLGLYLGNIYFAAGKMKYGAMISITSSVINVSSNIIFASFWGLKGLAIGASLGFLTGNIIQYGLVTKVIPQYDFKRGITSILNTLLAPLIAILFTGAMSKYFFHESTTVPIVLMKISIQVIVYVIILLIALRYHKSSKIFK